MGGLERDPETGAEYARRRDREDPLGEFRDRFDVPDDLLSVAVPRLCLLPLLENAVQHGIEPSESGGLIDVRLRTIADNMEIVVADTGHGVIEHRQTSGTGMGLRNVRARLRALYGEAGTLRLTENQPQGMVATLTLPLHYSAAAGSADA